MELHRGVQAPPAATLATLVGWEEGIPQVALPVITPHSQPSEALRGSQAPDSTS